MDQIKELEKVTIKPLFTETYQELMGNEYQEFLKYSLSYLTKTIRVNTNKISVEDFIKRMEDRFELKPVPWCKEAFWMTRIDSERYDLGNLKEHTLGYFYLQEAASLLPPLCLLENEKIPESPKALDMCAAPGSKTTQLAAMLNNEGLILANDAQATRLPALTMNLQRLGITNTVVTSTNGLNLKKMKEYFDYIMVDAPCSGTGTIRRSLKTLQMYSPGMISKLSRVQKGLIKAGFEALKPGGVMTYSTCTLEPEENEFVVSELLKEYDNAQIVPVNLKIKRAEPILSWKNLEINPECKDCLRVNPQDNNTEGFFVAKIKKIN